MRRLLHVVLVNCAYWWCVAGQVVWAGSSPKAGVVRLGEIRNASVLAGDSATVIIPVTIAEGYHVQANPASYDYLIPLELDLRSEGPDSFVAWVPVYPAPSTFRLEGTTEELLTYHGSIGVEVLLFPSEQARPGERLFTGLLKYQACDTRRCFFPTSVPVKFKLVISQ